jgi:hypothetical protein
MYASLKIGVLATLVAAFVPAMADDSPSAPPVKSPKAQMQDCMAKQRAAHSGMSEKAMRKACQNQLQSLQNHPSVPVTPNGTPSQDRVPAEDTPPPSNTPPSN